MTSPPPPLAAESKHPVKVTGETRIHSACEWLSVNVPDTTTPVQRQRIEDTLNRAEAGALILSVLVFLLLVAFVYVASYPPSRNTPVKQAPPEHRPILSFNGQTKFVYADPHHGMQQLMYEIEQHFIVFGVLSLCILVLALRR